MLGDSDWGLRRAATQVLGQIYLALINQGKPVNLSQLEAMLGDPDRDVRVSAAQALGQIYSALINQGKPVNLSQLEGMVGDFNRDVRASAAQASGSISEALLLKNQEDLDSLLEWFSSYLNTPLSSPLSGSFKERIKITKDNLQIGELSLERTPGSKVLPCVFTVFYLPALRDNCLGLSLKASGVSFWPYFNRKEFLD